MCPCPCRRAFYDKRVSQEVDGECLGEVRRLRRPRCRYWRMLFCCCLCVFSSSC